MKPANFPARKLERRQEALRRFKPARAPQQVATKNEELLALHERTGTTTYDAARAIRTKKRRVN